MLNSLQREQIFLFGVPMSFRRLGRLAAVVLPILLCVACGEVYRPVVIPIATNPPTPANFHAVFGISANVPFNPGGAMQVDVAGDSIIAATPTSDKSAPNLGNNPTYAAISPNDSRVFVTSAGSVLSGGVDVVSSFTPAFQFSAGGGFGAVNTTSLPLGSQPVFVNTTQNNAVYIASFGTNSVSAISTATNAVSNTATVGTNPVALAETPNGLKLYVANQGSNSVSSLNTVDLSANTLTGFSGTIGINPVWVVARGDSQKVYVLTQGDGKLITIDTATDTATVPDCSVTPSLCVGAGANFMFYDPHLNRLYVTNPVTSTVSVFSDTNPANDTPSLLKTISLAPESASCPSACSPVSPISVTALPDGSRFYVASYQLEATCPDPVVGLSSPCVIPTVSVFDANNFALKTTLPLLTDPPFSAGQSAVPPLSSCGPIAPGVPIPLFSPSATRFRVFTAAAADSSRVYVSLCDAGVIAVINTTNNNINNTGGSGSPSDTLVTDLPAAFSAGPVQSNGLPPNQNPIFLLPGQ
jgi:YVTN family beta-propeller protein